MIRRFLSIADPLRLLAIHRTLQFRLSANCGSGFRATHRSDIFSHQVARSAIVIGDSACIDGTIEVYERGRLTIGRNFFLGRSRIYCAHSLSIGDYVLISDGVSIMDSDLHPISSVRRRGIADAWASGAFPDVYSDTPGAPVSIADDVWIGFGASILKGVSIGQGAIVGAGSLVTSNVRPWAVVVGSPAREIRVLRDSER